MDFSDVFQISASGMALEKARLAMTAQNLANMHVTAPPGQAPFRPSRIIATEVPLHFAGYMDSAAQAMTGGVRIGAVVQLTMPPRMVHEPGHPHADEKGFVAYPNINHAAEMVNMSNALHAYEANVIAINAARTMAAHALEIGGQ